MATVGMRSTQNTAFLADDERIDPWAVAVEIWDVRWLILAGTATAAIVAAIVSSFIPKTYEATATVFVTPPTFASQLQPPPLSVEAYARLAESDFIRDVVQDELRRTKLLSDTERIGRLRTVLYASREPQKPYLPLIGLVAAWTTAEGARQIANTWAARFVTEQSKLSALSSAGSVAFIVDEFPKAAEALGSAEREMNALMERQGREKAETALMAGVELLRARVTALDERVVSLEERLATTRIDIQNAKQRLAEFDLEVKRNPQYFTVSKSISEDALWNALAGAQGTAVDKTIDGIAQQRLQTQEVNPVYVVLSEFLATERVRYNSLVPLEAALVQALERATAATQKARSELIASEMRLADLARVHAQEMAAAQRRIDEVTARFKPLEERIGEAAIAQARTEADVKVGAMASLPRAPVRPSVSANVAGAGVVGLVLSLAAAWVVTRVRRANQ